MVVESPGSGDPGLRIYLVPGARLASSSLSAPADSASRTLPVPIRDARDAKLSAPTSRDAATSSSLGAASRGKANGQGPGHGIGIGGRPLPHQSSIAVLILSLIHISEPTRLLSISYAVFCL